MHNDEQEVTNLTWGEIISILENDGEDTPMEEIEGSGPLDDDGRSESMELVYEHQDDLYDA